MKPESEHTLSIRIAGNTAVPCLQAIQAKGYAVHHYFVGDTPGVWDDPQWDADKDGRRFSATSPEELLGLIAMWEQRGDAWRQREGESEAYDQLVEAAALHGPDGTILDS